MIVTGTNRGVNPTNGHNPESWIPYGNAQNVSTAQEPQHQKHKAPLAKKNTHEIDPNRNHLISMGKFFAELERECTPIGEAVEGMSSYSC